MGAGEREAGTAARALAGWLGSSTSNCLGQQAQHAVVPLRFPPAHHAAHGGDGGLLRGVLAGARLGGGHGLCTACAACAAGQAKG